MWTEKLLENAVKNVWQYLRIEVDTVKGNASVKLNGKKCANFNLDAGYFDGINVEYSGEKSLLFTDVFVYEIPEIPADYVEEPVMPAKKDYITGMNVCSLWRNGHHVGWDAISPFDDVQTYLGNYDEGIPEGAENAVKQLLAAPEVIVEKKTKSGIQEQNISPMIHSVKIARRSENLLELNIMHCCQNPTLNPAQITISIEKYLPNMAPDFSKCKRLEVYDSKMQIFR